MNCFMCKGSLEEKKTTFMVDLGDHIIIIKDVPSILYPRMWTHRKKGWGKTLAKHCSDENGFRQCESFFMDRSRCRKLPLRLTEKPISMDSFKNVEFLEHGQSKKVWNPCNKTLVQGSESFRMDKVATVDER